MLALLIEDDLLMADFIRTGLERRGHTVEVRSDGRAGMIIASAETFDVAVIDRMLPDVDGLSIVRALRASGVSTPVIVLTALGGVSDRVEGLQAGADDYLVKPFDIDELDARMQALARRPPIPEAVLLEQGAFTLDRLRRRAFASGRELILTVSEFAMLDMLMLNAGRPVTKAMLLESVFNLDAQSSSVVVEPHVSRLRAKIVELGLHDPIRTLRKRGYSFDAS